MKKFLFTLMIVATLTFADTCAAADIWIEHLSTENLDIYVMDDTLRGDATNSGRYFKVSTKKVKDGQLQQIVNWTFSQAPNNNWRYETESMRGSHTTIVYNNKLFEFCMNRLGWAYSQRDGYYR